MARNPSTSVSQALTQQRASQLNGTQQRKAAEWSRLPSEVRGEQSGWVQGQGPTRSAVPLESLPPRHATVLRSPSRRPHLSSPHLVMHTQVAEAHLKRLADKTEGHLERYHAAVVEAQGRLLLEHGLPPEMIGMSAEELERDLIGFVAE